jgi:hypothetical protein
MKANEVNAASNVLERIKKRDEMGMTLAPSQEILF